MVTEPEVTAAEATGPTEPAAGKDGTKNERSAIVFPYNDLNFALAVARTIHEKAGQSCAPDQLAAWLGQNVRSGAFAAKLSVARIFGLIETERGVVRLTDIGRRIVDPAGEAAARADAFLHVPLYKAIYEKYRGYTLPPPAALEREMAALGVSSKQTDKARQAFERSADQSGFFATGRERLVMPPTAQRPDTRPIEEPPEERRGGGGGGGNGTGGGASDAESLTQFDPLIYGLLKRLPKAGDDWSLDERIKWLTILANVFDMVYKGDGGIEVSAARADRSPRPRD